MNTVFTDLEHTENYRVNSNKIASFLNTGYDAYISNGKTSCTVRFEVINLSCNPKITQENRLQWKFFQTCGRTHLLQSSPHDDRGKICSLGTSSLLASGLINVSYSANRTHQLPREKEKCASLGIMLGFPAFILVFYFHLVNLFCFLGKLTTGRPLPHGLPQVLSLPLKVSVLWGRGIYITSVFFFFLFLYLLI